MSSPSSDPTPEDSTGLTPGGSVPPGETPPAESGMSGLSDRQPSLPSARTNKIVYALVLGVVLLVGLMFVAYAVGLL